MQRCKSRCSWEHARSAAGRLRQPLLTRGVRRSLLAGRLQVNTTELLSVDDIVTLEYRGAGNTGNNSLAHEV